MKWFLQQERKQKILPYAGRKDDIYPALDSEKSEEKELLASAGTKVQEKIDLAERTLNETIITGYAASKRSKAASNWKWQKQTWI